MAVILDLITLISPYVFSINDPIFNLTFQIRAMVGTGNWPVPRHLRPANIKTATELLTDNFMNQVMQFCFTWYFYQNSFQNRDQWIRNGSCTSEKVPSIKEIIVSTIMCLIQPGHTTGNQTYGRITVSVRMHMVRIKVVPY